MQGNADPDIGDKVSILDGRTGIVKFIGQTDFAAGIWIGLELDQPSGKNDGTVNDRKYFQCREDHGVFVRSSQLKAKSPRVRSRLSLQSQSAGKSPKLNSKLVLDY
jgi:dynactin complex subunit